MVQSSRGETTRLEMGSRFGMSMKMGPLPYRMSNRVVEFEQDRLIAWAHFGKHRWRYELSPVEGGCEVTETFDWSTARSPKFIESAGYRRTFARSKPPSTDSRRCSLRRRSRAMTPEVHYWRPGCPVLLDVAPRPRQARHRDRRSQHLGRPGRQPRLSDLTPAATRPCRRLSLTASAWSIRRLTRSRRFSSDQPATPEVTGARSGAAVGAETVDVDVVSGD